MILADSPLLRPLWSCGTSLPPYCVTESAAAYEGLLQAHPALDHSGKFPSFDCILLGVGEDGHCGSLHPGSDETKATGKGKIVLPMESKHQLAISMDVMRKAKVVVMAATGANKAGAIKAALGGEKVS